MKRLRNWWRGLFHTTVLLDPRVTDPAKHMHIIELNKDSEDMVAGLGMTQERSRYLHELCCNTYVKSKNIVAAMEIVSKECVHANELFFVSTAIWHFHNKMSSGGFIAHLLSGLGSAPRQD